MTRSALCGRLRPRLDIAVALRLLMAWLAVAQTSAAETLGAQRVRPASWTTRSKGALLHSLSQDPSPEAR